MIISSCVLQRLLHWGTIGAFNGKRYSMVQYNIFVKANQRNQSDFF